jgi:S-formylglutathione hydrolase FrmB
VTDVRIPCQSIGGHLWYRIIVPRSAAGEQLPVLYLLHGGFGNPVDIQAHTDAVKQAVAHRLIVVTPDVGQSWYTNARHRQNARWEDAVAYDLVRDVESRFPALKGREHRGLAGVSMSGYGAVKLALKHPELYGYAASMAGAFDVTRRWPNILNPAQSWNEWMIFGFRAGTRRNEDVFAILPQAKSLQSVRWFLSCGSEDHFAADNRKLATLLHQRGAQVETFEAPGKHDWGPWNKALPELFRTAEESLR